MKMPEPLRKARLHLFAARREVDTLKGAGEFTLSLTQTSESLDKTLEWIDEYTEMVMKDGDG